MRHTFFLINNIKFEKTVLSWKQIEDIFNALPKKQTDLI